MIQSEQQFAEKIHALTLPRAGAPNSRVRDLVDLTLLVQSGIMVREVRVTEAFRRTFTRRGTHELRGHLTTPAEECGKMRQERSADGKVITTSSHYG